MDLSAAGAQAVAPDGTDAVPGARSTGEPVVVHAAAGPELPHCAIPSGSVTVSSAAFLAGESHRSIEHWLLTMLAAGTASTLGDAAAAMKLSW
jgi:hypothetical protein